jgi:hypothetical protein
VGVAVLAQWLQSGCAKRAHKQVEVADRVCARGAAAADQLWSHCRLQYLAVWTVQQVPKRSWRCQEASMSLADAVSLADPTSTHSHEREEGCILHQAAEPMSQIMAFPLFCAQYMQLTLLVCNLC